MGSVPPTPAPAPAADDNDLLRNTILGLLRACDIVFGSTAIILALGSSWLLALGQVRPLTVAALWAIPVFSWAASRRSCAR